MLCTRCWGSKIYHNAQCTVCNGTGMRQNIQLSKNFWLSEMVVSTDAHKLLLDNTEDAHQFANIQLTVNELMQPTRDHIGPCHVSSGIRCLPLNRAIGSKDDSAHPQGNAIDFEPMLVPLKEAMDWIIASPLPYDQVIFEGTWIHVARKKDEHPAPRREALMMFGGRYTVYDPKDPRVQPPLL